MVRVVPGHLAVVGPCTLEHVIANRIGGRAGMGFILVALFLDLLGIGLIIPVLPQLVERLSEGSGYATTTVYGALIAVYALMQFTFAPVLGALSDRFGRRPVLLVSIFGMAADYFLMAFAPSLWWLVVARVVSGITSANITAANAYIADVSTPEDRVKNFGMAGAAFGLGFIVGPAIGGFLGDGDPRVPFLVAASLSGLNFLYGLLVLPESLPAERRTPLSKGGLQRLNPFGAVVALRRYPSVLGLATTILFLGLSQSALQSTWVLFTAERFGWTPAQNGFSLTVFGVITAIMQAGLAARVVAGLGERRAFIVGLAVSAVAQLLYGFTEQGWQLYAVMVAGAVGGVTMPVAQSLVTRQVAPGEQGAVQGALASLQSLSAVIMPPIATGLLGYFTAPEAPVRIPGIAFFLGAALMAGATLLGMAAVRRAPGSPDEPLPAPSGELHAEAPEPALAVAH
jgi:MFS transporter, DHA1 family, tetracycline resistance protein